MTINHFIHMGGYGIYVWSSYLITLFVFSFNLIASLREKLRIKILFKQYFANER